ncbi:MAG: ABC transporter permease [Anaerolineae bacterium]|nr:ABC transporter permease [Anaerolineae bacterium]
MLQALTINLRQSYAFVARNFNLVKRYWGWELVWLAYSVASSLSVVFIGAGMGAITNSSDIDTNYLVIYLLIGALVWRYLAGLFDNISEMIQWERWEGTIEYTLMAPVHRFIQMLGQTLFAIAYMSLFTGVIAAAMALFFELDFSKANLAGAVAVLLAGSLSFVSFGIVASVLPLLYPERGTQMTHIVQAFLLLVSGVYYPVEVLPGWLQFFARISPATYVLEGMRAAMLEGASLADLSHIIWPLLLAGAVMLPIGVWMFRLGETYAKKAGKLKRNG